MSELFTPDFSAKTVVITGATRGIGRALSRWFHQCVANVIPVVRSDEAAFELLKEMPQRCFPVMCDVTDKAFEEELRSTLEELGKPLDVLINNAGIGGAGRTLEDVPLHGVRDLFEVHCVSALRSAQASLPWLLKASAPTIINVTSRYGETIDVANGSFGKDRVSYSYCIAKSAQNMLTACLHDDLQSKNIRVFAVNPGACMTSMGPPNATRSAEEVAIAIAECTAQFRPDWAGHCIDPISKVIEW